MDTDDLGACSVALPDGLVRGSPVVVSGGEGVQVGDSNLQLNVHVRDPAIARSSYLEQVRQIAPPALAEREPELADLARFCQDADRRYVWWRAGAWAGKSALLSWFVLHPPPGIQLVSFFVTARYPGQDDRSAFCDVVLEQLAELLGEPIPAFLTGATREPHLLRMLAQAAESCQRREQHLVLLVDGLDEDRGVTTGPDAHSIAALLPSRPPPGLKVIVSGRPSPPVPSDVPSAHPLRDPAIARGLSQSPQATVVKADMWRELKRLLRGSPAEQDLLGLIAAAGGGLGRLDLAALTGLPAWEVGEQLQAVTARTFAALPSRQTDDCAYMLGHEELQAAALESLGECRVADLRKRLHAWADGFRDRGWPAETPEYMLRSYYRMLHAAGDTTRITACATDRVRHDRMLAMTGGDAAALTEVISAQQALMQVAAPDLGALARLALRRDTLAERNAHIPTRLPAVWARRGPPGGGAAGGRGLGAPARGGRARGGG
jgi:hypothetical protein